MTDTTLAQLSNLAIYSAMAVLTLAMVMSAIYLARLAPTRAKAEVVERELVTSDGETAPAAEPTTSEAPEAESTRARKAGGIA